MSNFPPIRYSLLCMVSISMFFQSESNANWASCTDGCSEMSGELVGSLLQRCSRLCQQLLSLAVHFRGLWDLLLASLHF